MDINVTEPNLIMAIEHLKRVMNLHSDKLCLEDMRDLSRAATILESLK